MNNILIVKVNGGYFRAEPSLDPDYPGIDVEFISDIEDENNLSRPRILFERPIEDEKLRALIWNNPDNEDYEEEIEFCNNQSFTAFVYEEDNMSAADLSTYDNREEAIKFAKYHNWDDVVNDNTGEVV